MKVIGLRSMSHEQKSRKSLFSHCQLSLAHNSGSIKDKNDEVCVYVTKMAVTPFDPLLTIPHESWGIVNSGSNGVTAIFVT